MSEAPLFEATAATVELGRVPVLRDLDLRIERGVSTAVLGPNGAGKSTLLKLILREVYPLAGDGSVVRVLGRERWDVFALRRQLGVVSPELQLRYQRDASALDVVVSGFFASIGLHANHSPRREHRERSLAAMDRLGVSALAGQLMLALPPHG